MRRIIVLPLVLFVLFTLSACGNSPKSESQILDDLKSKKIFKDMYAEEFCIDSLTIEKRQTDMKEQTDTIYADIHLFNYDRSIEGVCSMVVSYKLYNSGWMLEEWKFEDESWPAIFSPLKGVNANAETLKQVLKSNLGATEIRDFIVKDENLSLDEFSSDTYSVSATAVHKYSTYVINADIQYSFAGEFGTWEEPNVIKKNITNEEWDISGTYILKGQSYTINNKKPQSNMLLGVRKLGHLYNAEKFAFDEFLVESNCLSREVSKAIKFLGYKVKFIDGFNNINEFNYFLPATGRDILFIGRNNIAISEDYEIDSYNRKIVIERLELKKSTGLSQ